MFGYGTLLQAGTELPADPASGFELIQRAAEKQYGPAMYVVGAAHLTGDRVDRDPDKGGNDLRCRKLGERTRPVLYRRAVRIRLREVIPRARTARGNSSVSAQRVGEWSASSDWAACSLNREKL